MLKMREWWKQHSAALLLVVGVTIALGAAAFGMKRQHDRLVILERRSAFLFAGGELQAAIAHYYYSQLPFARHLPQEPGDLIQPGVSVDAGGLLTAIPSDPLTGKQDWVWLRSDSGIVGVRSRCARRQQDCPEDGGDGTTDFVFIPPATPSPTVSFVESLPHPALPENAGTPVLRLTAQPAEKSPPTAAAAFVGMVVPAPCPADSVRGTNGRCTPAGLINLVAAPLPEGQSTFVAQLPPLSRVVENEEREELTIPNVGPAPQLRLEVQSGDSVYLVARKAACMPIAADADRCDALEGVDDRRHALCYDSLDLRIKACLEGNQMRPLQVN